MIKCIVANKYIVIDETLFLHFYNKYNRVNSSSAKKTKTNTRFKERFGQVYLNGITPYNKYGQNAYALPIRTGALKGKVLIALIGDLSYYENMNKLNKLFNSPINLITMESFV